MRVFHLDCFWMKKYEWCSFTFDPENFPDPKAYLKSIKVPSYSFSNRVDVN